MLWLCTGGLIESFKCLDIFNSLKAYCSHFLRTNEPTHILLAFRSSRRSMAVGVFVWGGFSHLLHTAHMVSRNQCLCSCERGLRHSV